METNAKTIVSIETTVNAPIEEVWEYWNTPEHITKWCTASDDWHTPWAKADFRVGGTFSSRMEAKDGSMGFEFGGVFDEIIPHQFIAYTMGDGRKVDITFTEKENGIHISQHFEAESTNPVEMQKDGWQNILNNFKKYTEGKK